MTRFYFHHYECGTVTEDPEGLECEDLQAAERHAFAVARRIMAEEIKGGEICLSCQIDIHDDQQRKLLSIPFRRAVTVVGL